MSDPRLSIGDEAPDFALPGDSGKTIRLSEYRGKRVILYFYPKDFTPGCTTQACGFRDRITEIENHNAVVLGVSPDGHESHRRFRLSHSLPFPLLADTDHRVAEKYGVWRGGLPFPGVIRSHFVIDEYGILADVRVDVKPEDSVERAVKAVAGEAEAVR